MQKCTRISENPGTTSGRLDDEVEEMLAEGESEARLTR
jgi:hypothetical protein